ncbi:MAG: extracellular solute-binding protein, partial [Actinomycetota bacterium]|nr:extracellular solute-binding protein [Actinomycetota bacterium]
TSGQADAGLVYVTDAIDAGNKVSAVAFPESKSAVNTYPIVALKGSEKPTLAGEFVEAVTGEPGQRVLGAAGFGAP